LWHAFADVARETLHQFDDVGYEHPVWSARPYKVFLRTPDEVRGRIAYVNDNPEKEGLTSQQYDFVRAYDNWPFHKVGASRSVK
jgi:hypothetical protein